MLLRVKQIVVFHLALAAAFLAGVIPSWQGYPDPVTREAYSYLLNNSHKLRAPSWADGAYTETISAELPNAPQLLLLNFGPQSAEAFQSSPPAPVDYAVVLYELEQYGMHRLAIADPLFWEDQASSDSSMARLGFKSLLNEMQSFESVLLGSPVDRTPQTQSLTSPMAAAAIPPERFFGDLSALPAANKLPFEFPDELPEGTRLTPTHIDGQTEALPLGDDQLQIPLLLRWGDRIIPSFTLGLVCDLLGYPPQELEVHLGSHIAFPPGNQIAINEFGYAKIPLKDSTPLLSLEAEALLLPDDADHQPNQKQFDQASLTLIGQSPQPLTGAIKPSPDATQQASKEEPPAQARAEFMARAANYLTAHSAIAQRKLLRPAEGWVHWLLLLNCALVGAVLYGFPRRALLYFPLFWTLMAALLVTLALRQGIWLPLPELTLAAATPLLLIPLLAWWKLPPSASDPAAAPAPSKEAEKPEPQLVELSPED